MNLKLLFKAKVNPEPSRRPDRDIPASYYGWAKKLAVRGYKIQLDGDVRYSDLDWLHDLHERRVGR